MELVFIFFSVTFYCPRRDFAQLARILRKVLTVEIYSPYARKNLDLLEQGPVGNDDVSIVCARKYEMVCLLYTSDAADE